MKDKKFKGYLFDLHKTLDLNIELINLAINAWKKNEEATELLTLFNAFKQKYTLKNKKQTLLNQNQSKILIETQILHEIRRKNEENSKYHMEKFKEADENLDSKEEYIKIFDKKLLEVEIYIGKATKSLVNSQYEKYKGWKMNEFLNVNNEYVRRRFLIRKEIEKMKKNINDVKEENMTYKDDDIIESNNVITFNGNANDDNNNNDHKKESDAKVKAYLNYYRNQIHVMQMRIKLLQNCFNNMSNTMNHLYFDMKSNIRKVSSSNKEELNKTADFGNEHAVNHNATINKSILNLDITRKLNHFMDFSIVLNKKGDETKYEELGKTGLNGLGNVSNLNLWDISCINKNT